MVETLRITLEYLEETFPDLLPRIIVSVVIIFLTGSGRLLFIKFIQKRVKDQMARRKWRVYSAYIMGLLIIGILFPIWLPSIRTALAVLGIFGAGVVIVLKEVFLNIAGWFYIAIRRPFHTGNRVTIGDFGGDVLDIRLMEFSMIEITPRHKGGQSTGRILHIPNALLLTTPHFNASKEFSFNWNELTLSIKPDSDWKKAEKIILEIATDVISHISESDKRVQYAENEYAIRYTRMTPTTYITFDNGAIHITLRHLTEPRQGRQITDSLWREILDRFKKEKRIQFDSGVH